MNRTSALSASGERQIRPIWTAHPALPTSLDETLASLANAKRLGAIPGLPRVDCCNGAELLPAAARHVSRIKDAETIVLISGTVILV
ncbi:hypothetical protein PTKU15_83550 [Paraburkholderia terrae]|nr:hypothetical protein PTKU15_83550 [Paraburkholderia terrae]